VVYFAHLKQRVRQAAKVSRDILDLEVCQTFFFSREGMRITQVPKAYVTDHDGQQWLENDGKRCKIRSTLIAKTGPIKYMKSGRN